MAKRNEIKVSDNYVIKESPLNYDIQDAEETENT